MGKCHTLRNTITVAILDTAVDIDLDKLVMSEGQDEIELISRGPGAATV